MAFSTINYTEPKQSTYRSIKLNHKVNGKEETIFFNTGNFVIDYYDYMLFIQEQNDLWYKENFVISGSSSWDHFYMDGDKYNESYFDVNTGEFLDWREALDSNDYDRYKYITEKCPKVAHLNCHKNFNMVKKYYRKFKKSNGI